MKDNRFIDLLNLYIDRQITAAETAELEAEIQHSPQRQAVYRQYCQIHSATKLVYESFRAGAVEQPAIPSGRPATIELFENRRRRVAGWTYTVGGLAAAACVAFAFVRYQHPNTDTQLALAPSQPVAVAAVPVASVKVVAAPAVAPTPVNPVSLRNAETPANYSAMLAALREQDAERAVASERWQSARAQSLFDDHLFDAKAPATAEPDQRTLRRQTAQQVEMTVFQFQR
jgi:hypothetical protein